jgi:hypothetical protein
MLNFFRYLFGKGLAQFEYQKHHGVLSTHMSIIPLFALPSGLKMTTCSYQEGKLYVSLLCTQPNSPCPVCSSAATRIHSRYQRRLADLPSTEQPLHIRLSVRKFFCDEPTCRRKIFTERLASFVAPKREG